MNEIVDVNIGPDFVYYDPKSNCVGVYEVVVVTRKKITVSLCLCA